MKVREEEIQVKMMICKKNLEMNEEVTWYK